MPTVWGWLLLLACVVGISVLGIANVHPFLACERPNDSDVFIIEGWVPDYVLDQGLVPFKEGHCRLIIATGGPLKVGAELARYKTYAGLTAARLLKMGFRDEQIVAVPHEAVDKDRTHAAALEVGRWLEKHPDVKRANLVTRGPHARRSYVSFKRILPAGFELGVCTVPSREYDPKRWWASSEGFRTVVSEAIAYAYVLVAGPR